MTTKRALKLLGIVFLLTQVRPFIRGFKVGWNNELDHKMATDPVTYRNFPRFKSVA